MRLSKTSKLEIETSKRIIQEIKAHRKKDLLPYEQLEKQLTQLEIEEEEEIMKLMMNTEGLSSCDSYTIDAGENNLKLSQNNLFTDNRSSKRHTPHQSDMGSLQPTNGVQSPDIREHNDLVFATEVETKFNHVPSKESTQKQVIDYKLAKSIQNKRFKKQMQLNNDIMCSHLKSVEKADRYLNLE